MSFPGQLGLRAPPCPAAAVPGARRGASCLPHSWGVRAEGPTAAARRHLSLLSVPEPEPRQGDKGNSVVRGDRVSGQRRG